jgi:tetratricopeptide (TPR) repeat protein
LHRDLHRGLEHLDRAIALFESEGSRARRFRLGNNPGVACFTTSALVLWMLGRPDGAVERANRAVALATDLGHPFTRAYALFHSGFLHLWRREARLVRDRAMGLLDVADEHDLQIWRALGRCLLGAATTAVGEFDDGLAQIKQGLDLYHGLKTPPVFWPLLLYLQAGAYERSGKPSEGLPLIDEAIEIAGSGLTLVPEFYLLKGDLLLGVREADGERGGSWFQRAFDVAEGLDARMLQLRAAIRLCRLKSDLSKAEGRGRVLRAVYDTFAEGFTTADLTEAKDWLGGPSGNASAEIAGPSTLPQT